MFNFLLKFIQSWLTIEISITINMLQGHQNFVFNDKTMLTKIIRIFKTKKSKHQQKE